ncbi:MAG: hypothetical protein ACYTEX_23345 [Planctomycetota bacterium]|jgi:hypothetical protein
MLHKYGKKVARLQTADGTSNVVSLIDDKTDLKTDANWGDDFRVGSMAAHVTDMMEVGGDLYMSKEDGFYEWDGKGDASNILPETEFAEFNCFGATYWHGGFLIPSVAGLFWTRTGKPVGPESNPENEANHPSLGSSFYAKHGRWWGLKGYGNYIYGLYLASDGTTGLIYCGRERESTDPPGWGPIIWHVIDTVTADGDHPHGVFITRKSEHGANAPRPCLWYPNGNNVTYMWLDKDGAPMSRRGDVDLATTGAIESGSIDFGCPRVPKQLHYISGWADDMVASDTFTLRAYLDGGSVTTVGSTITTDGYFDEFWTQDTNDTARALIFAVKWDASGDVTDLNGPHLRDIQIHAIALPSTTREWKFYLWAKDESMRTAKLIRTELEGYINDLLKYKLPGPSGDSFNGVMTSIEFLNPRDAWEMFRGQDIPRYIMEVTVREMKTS